MRDAALYRRHDTNLSIFIGRRRSFESSQKNSNLNYIDSNEICSWIRGDAPV